MNPSASNFSQNSELRTQNLELDTAYIKEIFPSIQGEGLLAGQRHVFLRFCDCNLTCDYCDTDFSRTEQCVVYQDAFGKIKSRLSNPLPVHDVISILNDFRDDPRTVVLTGG